MRIASGPTETPGSGEAECPENVYYARISRKLRLTQYLFLLFTVICAVLVLWTYRSGITYENLRYLFRDVDEAAGTSSTANTVWYTASDTNTYAYFRGNLAVASATGVTVHRSAGFRSFTDPVTFKAPIFKTSAKYLLAYDAGGMNFYLYNSLGRVYGGTLTTPITDGAAADNGSFALLTRAKSGGYEIRLYDKNFNLTATLSRSGFVYAIGFLDDGRLWLCEAVASGGTLCTDWSLYTAGSDTLDTTVRENGLVLQCGSTESGYYILTDTFLNFYAKNGEKSSSASFGTSDVLYATSGDAGVAVYLNENMSGAECAVYLYRQDGTRTGCSAPKGARGIALCGNTVCLLYAESLRTVQNGVSETTDLPEGAVTLLQRDGSTVIVCYSDYAMPVEIR